MGPLPLAAEMLSLSNKPILRKRYPPLGVRRGVSDPAATLALAAENGNGKIGVRVGDDRAETNSHMKTENISAMSTCSRRLLCVRGERQCCSRSAEERDELASSQLIELHPILHEPEPNCTILSWRRSVRGYGNVLTTLSAMTRTCRALCGTL
jgi:hypothetical protein